jgi:hypothetical protein
MRTTSSFLLEEDTRSVKLDHLYGGRRRQSKDQGSVAIPIEAHENAQRHRQLSCHGMATG